MMNIGSCSLINYSHPSWDFKICGSYLISIAHLLRPESLKTDLGKGTYQQNHECLIILYTKMIALNFRWFLSLRSGPPHKYSEIKIPAKIMSYTVYTMHTTPIRAIYDC